MIRFEDVCYRYPEARRPALDHITLDVEAGELVLAAGPSGAGKSTLLRAINGLVPHFYGGSWHGRVLVAGRDTREYPPRMLAGTVGFVFQDPEAQMVVDMVEDELAFGMENLGLDPRVMRRRVEEVLDQLEIAHLRRRPLHTLSGGERQRVAIAAVLTTQPSVLVLDEPTSQLDPHAAEEVLTAVQKINADLGLTVVLSEHRLERVVQYVDRIIFCHGVGSMERGRIEIGSPAQILRQAPFAPPLVEVARTLGWEPLPLTIKAARPHATRLALPPMPPPVEPEPSRVRFWRRGQEVPAHAPSLTVNGLDVALDGEPVLRDVSLHAGPAEAVAIMGRNGSGKTTLLRTIMGLIRQERGTIRVLGADLTGRAPEERGRLIGYVPQDPRAMLFQPTVRDELLWSISQGKRHSEPEQQSRHIREVLALLELEALADSHPRDLSTGEQQRTALATALVRDPPVLLLDEPTRGLDYLNKHRLVTTIRRLKDAGRTIMLVTHDVELVAACAGRVVLLGEGEVVTEGPTRTLLHESLIFSSQVGKLFPRQTWLTAEEALAGIRARTG